MARLAKLTDLSASNVRELLNGKRTPTQSVAERLIRVLDLDERMAAELLAATGRWTSSFSGGEVRLDSD
jgi:plasmid maintenance system antidote protein VapI